MNRQRWFVPWLWILPALVFLGAFLVYPVIDTIRVSLTDTSSSAAVSVDNYRELFTESDFRQTLLNNVLWLVLFTGATVALGLVIAVLTNQVRYEAAAKALIFIPMAISFVAAGVIWTFMYQFQPDAPGFTQTGTVNAVWTGLGGSPVAWLIDDGKVPVYGINNLAIIAAGIWMWTGFAMVILSAGLKGISTEVLEAARVDGAREGQIFRRIIIPMLWPTIAVVGVTLMITSLKTFDLVFVMTGGRFDTDLVATRMWREMFINLNFGRASAVAVVLILAIVPIMLLNIRRFRQEERGLWRRYAGPMPRSLCHRLWPVDGPGERNACPSTSDVESAAARGDRGPRLALDCPDPCALCQLLPDQTGHQRLGLVECIYRPELDVLELH